MKKISGQLLLSREVIIRFQNKYFIIMSGVENVNVSIYVYVCMYVCVRACV